MKPKDPDVLGRALAKQAEGRGTSNTEKRALSDYARGKIGRDHFAAIQTTPVRDPRPLWQQSSQNPHTTIEKVEGLQAELRRGGRGGSDTAALEARIADLEAILGASTFSEFTICDSGSPATVWMQTWAADPTP